jgi:hypothetical protein
MTLENMAVGRLEGLRYGRQECLRYALTALRHERQRSSARLNFL